MSNTERRLPVYLLLDCSESMVGDGIESVQRGVTALLQELRSDPYALETVWLSIITFAHEATQAVPLTSLDQVSLPPLRVRPGTALGAGLTLLHNCIRREVRQHTAESKGDWRPIVFLFTDGVPTDSWERAAADTRNFHFAGPLNVIAIGCGEDVDDTVLSRISANVLMLRDYTPGDYQRLFAWVSASLALVSRSLAQQLEQALALADPPDGLLAGPSGVSPETPSGLQRQMFLALQCSRTRRRYLIRYRLDPGGSRYVPVRTYPVDEGYLQQSDASAAGLSVSSELVMGVLPCPHCENDVVGRCECGTIFCCDEDTHSIVCPGCGSSLTMREGGAFDLAGRQG